MTELSADRLAHCPYPEFVGLINQTNVPPGAYGTIADWAIYGFISESSNVLEVACSTGFSSREISKLTGCHAHGFDLDATCVNAAATNAINARVSDRCGYSIANGYSFAPKTIPTHTIVGASLRFFPDPAAMLRRLIGWFGPEGYILAADFSARGTWSAAHLKVREDTFGLLGSPPNAREVLSLYNGLDLIYHRQFSPVPESDDDLQFYCKCTIDRFCLATPHVSQSVRNVAFERLLRVKRASNFLRAVQDCHVLVFRYSNSTYPNRYVELF